MKINVMLDEGAKMPTKAHEEDAGFDLYAKDDFIVPEYGKTSVDLGVHIEIPKGYVGMLKSKSGLNVKYNLTCEGVIDSGYTGSIVAKIYNHGNNGYIFKKGDKVTQIVILPIPYVELTEVDSFEETSRGNNGFGSSGV